MNSNLSFKVVKTLESLYYSLNDILLTMPTFGGFKANDDIWKFIDHKNTVHLLDFNFFNNQLFNCYQKNELTYNDEIISINLKLYVKVLFLHTNKSSKSTSFSSNRFNLFKMLCTYLAQTKLSLLNESQLKDFYSILFCSCVYCTSRVWTCWWM